jgi:formylglycine-generating enzyme required for sulfatase activity
MERTGRLFRLPTEAEWEYACRAGTTTPFHFGATLSAKQANYNACYTYGRGKKGTFRQHIMSVGSFPPNAFGLFDMHGNVWEWCQDAFAESFYRDSPACDPRCYGAAGNQRVIRGGAWNMQPAHCRSAHRAAASWPGSVGCRVVLEPES